MVLKKCEMCSYREEPDGERHILFPFPLNPSICAKWVQETCKKCLEKKTIQQLHETRYVCEMHFRESDFTSKNTISEFAVPIGKYSSNEGLSECKKRKQKEEKDAIIVRRELKRLSKQKSKHLRKVAIRRCILPGCASATPAQRVCRWPHTLEVSEIWLKVLSPHVPGLLGIPQTRLRERVVCTFHFEDKCFLENGRRSLWGVPMLFTKEEMSSGQPNNPYCLFVKKPSKIDHTYARPMPSNCPLQPIENTDLPPDKFIEKVANSLYSINKDHDYTSVDLADRRLAFTEGDEEIAIRTSIVVPPAILPENLMEGYRPNTLEELIDYCDIRSSSPPPEPEIDTTKASDLKPQGSYLDLNAIQKHRITDKNAIYNQDSDNTLTANNLNSMEFAYMEDNGQLYDDSNENETKISHEEFARLYSDYQKCENAAKVTKGYDENMDPLSVDTKIEHNKNEKEHNEIGIHQGNKPTAVPKVTKRVRVKRKKLSPAEEKEWLEREKEWRRKHNRKLMLQRKKRAKNRPTPRQTFDKLTEKLNPLAKEFMWMQIKMAPYLDGREKRFRFTLQEKLLAQAIQEKSEKTYKFLQQIFIMPSLKTLKQMRAKAMGDPNFASEILELLKDDEDAPDQTELEEAVSHIQTAGEIEE
ncbi:hypothetical protein JYU34_005321 [Plutella xylostella]|uniref:THAP-type domain-containing protein n=1 Tax=Plutella xylostella TaxID=51655 RepID=A0ABQ7QWE6_PLUXY|nr:hypothetical protein JYU34_005321 [Plutella xylostella]